MARKIVVCSGKGGVGKTTVAANLGAKISQNGKRVCVVDADFGLNNLDVAVGAENRVVYDVADCVEGRCRAKQALAPFPSAKNAYILPSLRPLSKHINAQKAIKELIDGLSLSFDYILIDCPAGTSEGFSIAVSAAEEAIVVTTPLLSSLRDADKTLSILRGRGVKSIGLVVNRTRGDLVASGDSLSPEDIEQTLKCPLVGIIPEDDNVFLRNAGQIPNESPSAKAFKILAQNILSGKNKRYDYLSPYVGFWGSLRRIIKKRL